jgi:hypothetical protein
VTLPAAPGDVLAVHGGGPGGWLVRVGEAMAGKPTLAGHVVGITHQDELGRWIGIQGQPGGVGLVDCTPYLSDSRTRSNHAQPKPQDWGKPDSLAADDRLVAFLTSCAASLGLRYDWAGIAADIAGTLHATDLSGEIDRLWRWPASHGTLPADVVCSSLFAMLYDLPGVGWAHPDLGTERMCTPSDWWLWADEQQWAEPLPGAA